MRDAWAGIDLGTQSARVLILGDDGGRLGLEAAPLSSVRDADRHEQDPAEWLRVVELLLLRATGSLPPDVRVRGVAVSGTSGTLVPLDAAGRPTGRAVMYDDRRGADRLPAVERAGAAQWQRMGYRMQASWGLPKLLAMRSELPAGTRFGHQPDVITAALTGGPVPSDLSSALKTGADLDAVAWPSPVMDALGVPEGVLPDLVETGAVIGEVSADAEARTGLPAGCAVVAGCTDGCAAQFAAGALRSGVWNSVLGTTLVLKGVAPRRILDPGGAVYSHRAPFDGGWLPGGASNTGARAVSALLPGRDLPALTREAAALTDVPVAYPLLGRGERFPFVDDAAAGFWPGGEPPESDAEVLRAIAFGVAFLERFAFDVLHAIGLPTAGPVLLTGGGARNAWWNGLRAAVLGRPVAIPAETEGAAGTAVLAAAAITDSAAAAPLLAAAERLLGDAAPVEPLDLDAALVDEAYWAFRARIERGAA